MERFKFKKSEIDYIKNCSVITDQLKSDVLKEIKNIEDYYEVHLTDDQIMSLESLFSEQLQKVGFDENYNLTEEGELLEDIIDKISS